MANITTSQCIKVQIEKTNNHAVQDAVRLGRDGGEERSQGVLVCGSALNLLWGVAHQAIAVKCKASLHASTYVPSCVPAAICQPLVQVAAAAAAYLDSDEIGREGKCVRSL
jgi:hypothetical protein